MAKTCPQCQSEAADAATFCPSCGASLAPAAATGAAPPPPAGAPAGSPASVAGSSVPPFRFDAARWTLADRIAGIATIVLFISLFLNWFSISGGIAGLSVTISATGLQAHGYLYIVLILSIVVIAYLVLKAGWDKLPINQAVPHVTTMMVATIINLVLVFIGFIFKPAGGWGWSFGAFLGLIAAAVAAAPYAVPQLRAKTM
ncbi:MAG TPA: zinc ribbon domain-containing protein [Acidimicrobiales bacterium]|jgi:hypothetical protein|nr:zinc ribbon domain-containing protein [Acidimicrobiales bacterium]